MFGYVRARWDCLSEEEQNSYQAVYCSVCRTMGKEFGHFSRLFLNYDFAFLAMLLAPGGIPYTSGCKGCILHPVKGRPFCEAGAWMEQTAGESVILTYWKLKDSVADRGFWKGLIPRFLRCGLYPGYRKAREGYPEFDQAVTALLNELRDLEEAKSPSIDQTADCFARLLQGASIKTGNEAHDRALEQLLYHVGRWIYLIDAVDDLAEDQKSGNYNPVMLRFPHWTEGDRAYLRTNLEHSLSLARTAFQLMEPNAWTPVVENILCDGLPGVTELVFTGKWREYKKRGAAANERSI